MVAPNRTLNPKFMKSAYELAMERLEKEAPTRKLSEKTKAELAEIDSTHKAKTAERELFLKEQIRKAQNEGKLPEALELEAQLQRDLRRIQQDCEEKKERLRASQD